ncbi:hypothetical protein [Shouchella shacheensis]|uniref:hypothetical protein n=1 Tax=Shouchella shacheensis TaxID=1649580 RepID=UPI00073FB0C0|nr:hypothetical protein [Shouchella shacheensis]
MSEFKRNMAHALRLIVFSCLLVVVDISSTGESLAQPLASEKQIIVILVPGLSFADSQWLLEEGQERELWREAAKGAMNIRTAGGRDLASSMATLSAGRKAVTPSSLHIEEREHVHALDFPEFVAENQATRHRATPGYFAQRLKQAGIETSYYGHSDTHYGALLAMDEKGQTSGAIASAVKKSSEAARGIEMNGPFLLEAARAKEGPSFTVIEWGDLHRLYATKEGENPAAFESEHNARLKAIEAFVAELQRDAQPDHLLLLSPMMHEEAYKQFDRLAPVFYWNEKVNGGIVTSKTTRQTGIVSNLDFLPFVRQQFGLERSEQEVGYEIEVVEEEGRRLFETVELIKKVAENRAPVLKAYLYSLVAVAALSVGGAFIHWKRDEGSRVLRVLALAGVVSPLPLLLSGYALQWLSLPWVVAMMVGFSLFLGLFLTLYNDRPLLLIFLALIAVVTIDVAIGSPLAKRSFLGYDPIVGARYYGIGNEYAGFFCVAGLFVLGCLRRRGSKAVLATLLLVVLGANSLGANAGAMLAFGLSVLFLFWKMGNGRWWILWGVGGGLALLGGLYLLQFGRAPTHIAAGFGRMASGDWSYIWDTMVRKMSLNAKLLLHSRWSLLLVVSVLLLLLLRWRRGVAFLNQSERLFLQTGVACAIGLLLLNDSGVVAAAGAMYTLVSVYSYWWLLRAGREKLP